MLFFLLLIFSSSSSSLCPAEQGATTAVLYTGNALVSILALDSAYRTLGKVT